jgi:hypothetical protein
MRGHDWGMLNGLVGLKASWKLYAAAESILKFHSIGSNACDATPYPLYCIKGLAWTLVVAACSTATRLSVTHTVAIPHQGLVATLVVHARPTRIDR